MAGETQTNSNIFTDSIKLLVSGPEAGKTVTHGQVLMTAVFGAVGGAAAQGYRANKRIEAANKGKSAEKFRFGIL